VILREHFFSEKVRKRRAEPIRADWNRRPRRR
jgi:hypothetical protein